MNAQSLSHKQLKELHKSIRKAKRRFWLFPAPQIEVFNGWSVNEVQLEVYRRKQRLRMGVE